jgi:hypothetical protein
MQEPTSTSPSIDIALRQSQLLFKILVGEDEYRIFTNGRVEGFGEGDVKVVNYYPRLCSDLLQGVPARSSWEADTEPPNNEL